MYNVSIYSADSATVYVPTYIKHKSRVPSPSRLIRLKMVQVLVHNLPAQVDVAGRAGLRPQLAEGRVAKVQARGAL